MKMKNEQEIVTAYFKVLSWNLPGQLKKVIKSLRIHTTWPQFKIKDIKDCTTGWKCVRL